MDKIKIIKEVNKPPQETSMDNKVNLIIKVVETEEIINKQEEINNKLESLLKVKNQ